MLCSFSKKKEHVLDCSKEQENDHEKQSEVFTSRCELSHDFMRNHFSLSRVGQSRVSIFRLRSAEFCKKVAGNFYFENMK